MNFNQKLPKQLFHHDLIIKKNKLFNPILLSSDFPSISSTYSIYNIYIIYPTIFTLTFRKKFRSQAQIKQKPARETRQTFPQLNSVISQNKQ